MTTSTNTRLAGAALVVLLTSLVVFAQVGVSVRIPRKPQLEKFHGEVLHMTRLAITVRHRENLNLVRTFTYDEKLAPQMADRVDRDRPFQHGDRVEIHFLPGSDKAVKIKGKPSPPRGGIR